MEPTVITAGTSASWTRADDYAYGLWDFSYILTGPERIAIATESDSGTVTASVTALDTAEWTAGKYQWILVRESGTDSILVGTGYLTVNASPFIENTVIDHRSHAEKMLIAIEARLENRAASDYEQYSIEGRSLARIPFAELNKWRIHYRNEVARLQRRESGKKSPRRIIYRMP